MSDLLTLKIGGQIYGGWKSVSIRTGIEQIAGSFDLAITERWPNQPTEWAIPPGESCVVLIGDDVVISGYVDSVAVSYDDGSHEIKVTGRDRAGDLVDCSAPSTAFSGLTFEEICQRLCAPFSVEVFDETTGGKRITTKQKKAGKKGTPPKKIRAISKVPKQAVQNGESVFKTLEKLGRSEGVLLVSDGEGGIVITRAGLGGDCQTMLEFGKNILRASFEHSHANLFSEITVKGQAAAPNAGQFDVVHASPKGTVNRKAATTSNSGITRYRPLIIVAETQADAARCQKRAEWEAGNREAKARRVSITVQGWREDANGELWRINKRVRVKCPWMRIDEWLLIAAVSYKLDDGGTTAELSLVPEKALDQLPEIPQAQGGAAGKFQVVGGKK